MSRVRREALVTAALALPAFVVAGYLVPLRSCRSTITFVVPELVNLLAGNVADDG